MKKLFLTAVFLAGIFLVGCQDSNFNPVSPSENQPALQKNSFRERDNLADDREEDASNALIKVTKAIDGNNGGQITIDRNALLDNHSVHVNANLEFGKNAFNGVLKITVIVNPRNASVVFLPHIRSFNGNVKLDMTLTGVDLSKLHLKRSRSVHFSYFKDRIPVERIRCQEVGISYRKGMLTVKAAELKHFSRYAWAN